MRQGLLFLVLTIASTWCGAVEYCHVTMVKRATVVANLCYDFSGRTEKEQKILAEAYCAQPNWPGTKANVVELRGGCPKATHGRCRYTPGGTGLAYVTHFYETGLGTLEEDNRKSCEQGQGRWLVP